MNSFEKINKLDTIYNNFRDSIKNKYISSYEELLLLYKKYKETYSLLTKVDVGLDFSRIYKIILSPKNNIQIEWKNIFYYFYEKNKPEGFLSKEDVLGKLTVLNDLSVFEEDSFLELEIFCNFIGNIFFYDKTKKYINQEIILNLSSLVFMIKEIINLCSYDKNTNLYYFFVFQLTKAKCMFDFSLVEKNSSLFNKAIIYNCHFLLDNYKMKNIKIDENNLIYSTIKELFCTFETICKIYQESNHNINQEELVQQILDLLVQINRFFSIMIEDYIVLLESFYLFNFLKLAGIKNSDGKKYYNKYCF